MVVSIRSGVFVLEFPIFKDGTLAGVKHLGVMEAGKWLALMAELRRYAG